MHLFVELILNGTERILVQRLCPMRRVWIECKNFDVSLVHYLHETIVKHMQVVRIHEDQMSFALTKTTI